MTKRHLTILLLTLAMVAAGCGDDGGSVDAEPQSDGDTADSPSESEETGSTDLEDSVDDLVDDPSETQASQGGGSATLTVGDQTWTFDSVLCAFGEEMIGQEGAVFNLSSIQDGLQMYASIDSFGHSVSLDDIEDVENPSVSLSSAFDADDFIVLDDKTVTAEVDLVDGTTDDFTGTPATFSATCP